MVTFTLDSAKADLDNLVARVLDRSEPATVTTPEGGSVVVLPSAEYTAWIETAYLLSHPANAAHLRQSLDDAAARKLLQQPLAEP